MKEVTVCGIWPHCLELLRAKHLVDGPEWHDACHGRVNRGKS
jgi:hypothetical protein